MKLRIALISANRDDQLKLKKEFPDLYIHHGRNVLELVQTLPNQPIEAVVFMSDDSLSKDFNSFYNYLRSKPNLKKAPVAILTDSRIQLPTPVKDPLVRMFTKELGIIIPLMDFFHVVKNPASLEKLVTPEKIEELFRTSLGEKLGQGTGFKSRHASDDEARGSFFCQQMDEVSSNLMWIKFSARILENGSSKLKEMYSTLNESEAQQAMENILSLTFKEFTTEINNYLNEVGAARFHGSDKLPMPERSPYIKTAKSTNLIFESSVCSILLEVIRYI